MIGERTFFLTGTPLQARVASGDDVFGPLIRKYLLNNQHRVTVEMLPDNKLGAQKEQEEKEKLLNYRQTLSEEQVEDVIKKTQELKERQVPTGPDLSGSHIADPARNVLDQESLELVHNFQGGGNSR